MDLSKIFPHPADVIAQDAARYRELSAVDQSRHLFGLIASTEAFLADPLHRAKMEKLLDDAETAWRNAHRAVFASHE